MVITCVKAKVKCVFPQTLGKGQFSASLKEISILPAIWSLQKKASISITLFVISKNTTKTNHVQLEVQPQAFFVTNTVEYTVICNESILMKSFDSSPKPTEIFFFFFK